MDQSVHVISSPVPLTFDLICVFAARGRIGAAGIPSCARNVGVKRVDRARYRWSRTTNQRSTLALFFVGLGVHVDMQRTRSLYIGSKTANG